MKVIDKVRRMDNPDEEKNLNNEESKSDKRTYNVFFNLHTVSGIVISVGLFICFFAGAFALFQEEINHWETNSSPHENHQRIDYEQILSSVKKKGYSLENRVFNIGMREMPEPSIYVFSQAVPNPSKKKLSSTDSIANSSIALKIDPKNYQIIAGNPRDGKETVGGFLYRLHYFDQIPVVGLYIAGFVALFFLFAIITGVIIHWKKIFTNFFTFRIKASLKNLWTDGHTALGIIGLPFQFMYAVTGAFYGLSIVILIPSVLILFDGNQSKVIGTVYPAFKVYDNSGKQLSKRVNLNELRDKFLKTIEGESIKDIRVNLGNITDDNAYITFNVFTNKSDQFYGTAYTTYSLKSEKVIAEKKLNENSYKSSVMNTISNLHFAQYGGYFVKSLYFLLALITCFVIISGVMIWLVARDKKSYDAKKKFNTTIGGLYLGICLGLFPSVAFLFVGVKLLPSSTEDSIAYYFFGLFWLLFTVYSFIVKSPSKINQSAVLLGGILAVLIPITNGLTSGIWLWHSWSSHLVDSFFVDTAWLVIGIISVLYVFKNKFSKTKQTPQIS